MEKSVQTLAIDPGLRATGWACFAGQQLTGAGLWRTSSRVNEATAVEAMAEQARLMFRGVPFAEIVSEVPQVYQQRQWSGDPNDLISVALVAGAIVGALLTQSVKLARPREWKGQAKKEVTTARSLARLGAIERAIVQGMTLDIPASLRHNTMDAIGIGLWRLGRAGRIER